MEVPISEVKSKAWYQVWWEESIWPGLGLFGESYMLFSIGTLRPVWELLYPNCWSDNNDDDVCSEKLLHSLSYNVVMGVICGMIIIGTLANRIGRRNGSILTAFLMAFGGLGLCASSLFLSSDPHTLFSAMSALLFIFGIGVGGEYPLSASSASERAMITLQQNMEREKKQQQTLEQQQAYVNFDHTYSSTTTDDNDDATTGSKGKRVILVFAMQGMGIFINSLTLTFLLMLTNQFGSNSKNGQNNANAQGNNVNNNQDNYYWDEEYDDAYVVNVEGYYNKNTLLGIWRIVYAIGAGTLAYVFVSRMYYLEESQVWKEDQERREYMMTKEVMMSEMRESSVRFSTIDGDFIPDPTWDQPLGTGSSEEQRQPPRRMSFFTYKFSSMRDMTQSVRQSITSSTRSISLSSKSEYFLLFKHFGMRLFGTSMSWLLWDIAFYGNKLFQSSFLLALTGEDATLMDLSAGTYVRTYPHCCHWHIYVKTMKSNHCLFACLLHDENFFSKMICNTNSFNVECFHCIVGLFCGSIYYR